MPGMFVIFCYLVLIWLCSGFIKKKLVCLRILIFYYVFYTFKSDKEHCHILTLKIDIVPEMATIVSRSFLLNC